MLMVLQVNVSKSKIAKVGTLSHVIVQQIHNNANYNKNESTDSSSYEELKAWAHPRPTNPFSQRIPEAFVATDP